jgi:uncharacterized protein
MSKLRNKLKYLEKDKIKQQWESIDSKKELSTREKLEKLVNTSLKNSLLQKKTKPPREEPSPRRDSSSYSRITTPETSPASFSIIGSDASDSAESEAAIVREYTYPLDTMFGRFKLEEWATVTPELLAVLFSDDEADDVSPMNLLFFDTETTGLSGGTGTIPFMLGFGFFDENCFRVKIFTLSDLTQEEAFLEEVDQFLQGRNFSGTVTYNGKSFDFPLMETRYILQRRRFPLLRLPHLDFLYPARVIWKHTYDSRRLGYLGDMLLGLSRDDDIDGSQIPPLYFNFLRSKSFSILQDVVEHNALDLVGMAALILVAAKYLQDITFTNDEGEILGTAKLFEKYGLLEKSTPLYEILKNTATRTDIKEKALKGLANIKKRHKLYNEASELWQQLLESSDHHARKELSIHYEHREKNYHKALYFVQQALSELHLTEAQRTDFKKRLTRLTKKIATLNKDD